VAAAAVGVTGFASLALQVVWTRLLASMLGPTTYAFSAVVAIFILGIAGGSALGAWLSRRLHRPLAALAVVLAACAALTLVAATTVDPLLRAVAELVAQPDVTFEYVVAREWAFTAAVLLPMALAFGAAFPLAMAVATRDESSMVADLGAVYAVNTAGAIAGALGAGFLLVPWLGLHDTIRVIGIVMALGSIALAVACRPRVAWLAAAAGLAAAAAAWQVPEWDPRLLSSGAYKYARAVRGPDLITALTAGDLQYYREGSTATVAVRRLTGTTSLSIDGKVDASDAADMLTQRLLAHVPLLLHRSAAGGDPRAGQRRHGGLGAHPRAQPRRCPRNLAGSGRSLPRVRSRQPSTPGRFAHQARGR
jgi:spermidine synthase